MDHGTSVGIDRVDYVPRRPPRAHQARALEKMRGKRAFALRHAMRTGKSKCLIDDFGRMAAAGEALDLLVVAPAGLYRTWPGHLAADLPDWLRLKTRVFLWDSGRARGKAYRAELAAFMEPRGVRVLVVNVEALGTVEAARELCQKFLLQRFLKTVVAVDESVKIKNPDSKCGQFVAEVLRPLAAYRRILTGLVAPRSPLDLWNQYRFLDPRILGHDVFSTFRARYAVVKKVCMEPDRKLRGVLRSRLGLVGYLTQAELQVRCLRVDPSINPNGMSTRDMRLFLDAAAEGMKRDQVIDAIERLGGYVQHVPIVEGYRDVDELARLVEPHSDRCRLEDCADLPPSTWSRWDVQWHPEQRRVYEELRTAATAELASMDHVTATHVVVRILRLHQVLCGHVVDEEGREHDVPERRTEALLELLEDYDGKAVVWCSYRRSVERVAAALQEAYGEGSVARFWGGNVATREDEEARFKADLSCRFMVATPDAGRYGRDWAEADLCVYYSSRNDLDHRSQSEERVRSAAKTRPVAYVDLRLPGTVDDRIIDALRNKINLAAVIDGDSWREWVI